MEENVSSMQRRKSPKSLVSKLECRMDGPGHGVESDCIIMRANIWSTQNDLVHNL
jgi:hypothetical protein